MVGDEQRLNVAVWGLGAHAFKNVLPAIAASVAAKLVGVYSREEASCRRAGAEFSCGWWSDAASMLADDRVNAVYLATPIGLHFEQGMNVLSSGRHLICEKSLTDAYDKSIHLVVEARRRRLILCEAFMYRFHPRIRSVFELVRREEFGALVAVTCNFFLPELERPGYRYTASLGGGAFLDAGCYPISLISGFNVEPLSVSQARFHHKPGIEVNTSGLAVLQWGVRGQAYLGWGYGAAYRNEATIIGERQSLYIDQVFAKGGSRCTQVLLRDVHGKEEQRNCETADGFVEMLAYAQKALFNEQMKETLWGEAAQQAKLMEQVRALAIRD
jgi:predicted dehydrogenase